MYSRQKRKICDVAKWRSKHFMTSFLFSGHTRNLLFTATQYFHFKTNKSQIITTSDKTMKYEQNYYQYENNWNNK